MRSELGAISVPTLVISGRLDESTPPERGAFIAGEIAGSRHVVFEAAHLSNVEQAVPFTSALLEHLGSLADA